MTIPRSVFKGVMKIIKAIIIHLYHNSNGKNNNNSEKLLGGTSPISYWTSHCKATWTSATWSSHKF